MKELAVSLWELSPEEIFRVPQDEFVLIFNRVMNTYQIAKGKTLQALKRISNNKYLVFLSFTGNLYKEGEDVLEYREGQKENQK